jgi:virulence-associated protein VapD
MNKRIYLSVFDVREDYLRTEYDTKLADLLRMLEQEGFEVVYGGKFISYEWIEAQLEQCDAIVAIVDSYWQSSTWKGVELTTRLLPTFVVSVPEDFDLGWIKTLEDATVLTGSSAVVIQTIMNHLHTMCNGHS